MATKTVDVPGIGQLQLTKHRHARSLKIMLGADGTVKVTLPPFVPFQAGIQFALSKKDWINQHRQPVTLLEHGINIGKQHSLFFKQDRTKQKITTRTGSSLLTISFPATLQWNSPAVQIAARKLAIKALKQQAEELLPPRLDMLAETHNFTYSSVSVRQLKARWGSCNSKQEIVLNLFLMQLPWALIDYVLLHELSHTKALHHGPNFWAIFEEALPGAKQRRALLREYKPAI